MAEGTQPTVAQVNATLTSLALQLRNLAAAIEQQWAFLNKLGTTGLENIGGTGQGFSATDAGAALQDIDYMQTVTGVYKGTIQAQGTGGTGAILFNFEDALTHLWSGQ